MALVRYLTHPQVVIDPNLAVPDWRLSRIGRARVEALAARDVFAGTVAVISSEERKAVETAAPIASALDLASETAPGMHENDRSATGYLPAGAFEALADRFFDRPEDSAEGWERAIDAQRRIVAAARQALARAPAGDLLLVGHGAVGALLWCSLSALSISRIHDQPGTGGGNCFAFQRETGAPVHGWTAMESL